ncbi:hypothetical protein [Jannaschia sp. R86511]|uniref:hypothetical protein n=1 Tax=Jannaschia sp. R86511 TaxID=3093853 RepID=UPI0036D3CA9B
MQMRHTLNAATRRFPVLTGVLSAVAGCTAAAVLLAGPAIGAHPRDSGLDPSLQDAMEGLQMPATFTAPADLNLCDDAYSCWSVEALPAALQTDLTELLATVSDDVTWNCEVAPSYVGEPVACRATGHVGRQTVSLTGFRDPAWVDSVEQAPAFLSTTTVLLTHSAGD